MMSKRLMWTAALVAAALAPAAFGVGVYFGGGLAAYGETKIRTSDGIFYGDMGPSWAAGGGLAVPVWWRGGAVATAIDATTDVNFSMIDKKFEEPYLYNFGLKMTAVPIRETVVVGVGVGPSAMVKPYVGFGGGVTIVKWEVYYPVWFEFPRYLYDVEIDSGTDVKLTFGIPFGCDFRLTPNFSLGPRAEYLVITGDVNGVNPFRRPEDAYFEATVPNIFLFGASARLDF